MPKQVVMLRFALDMLAQIDELAQHKQLTRTSMIIMLIMAPLAKAMNTKRLEDKRREERNEKQPKAD